MLDIIDSHTLALIFHLIGIAIGAGGAYMSDFMFFSAMKDLKISHTEMRFLHLGGKVVWLGIVILVISGLTLFMMNPEQYLNSAKFLSKMTVVGIIIANGMFFHLMHIPRIRRHVGEHLPSSDEFTRKITPLFISGAVSVISWTAAIVLGAWRGIPYTYVEIIAMYVLSVLAAAIIAYLVHRGLVAKERH